MKGESTMIRLFCIIWNRDKPNPKKQLNLDTQISYDEIQKSFVEVKWRNPDGGSDFWHSSPAIKTLRG